MDLERLDARQDAVGPSIIYEHGSRDAVDQASCCGWHFEGVRRQWMLSDFEHAVLFILTITYMVSILRLYLMYEILVTSADKPLLSPKVMELKEFATEERRFECGIFLFDQLLGLLHR